MPVHLLTILAMSSSSTSSFNMRATPAFRAVLRGVQLLQLGSPAWAARRIGSCAARSSWPLRVCSSASKRRASIFFFSSLMRLMASRSLVQRARRAVICSVSAASFALHLLAALDAVGVGLALQRCALDFERGRLALELIDLGGHGADLNGERSGGFVHQVDGLVGQKAVADVAMRERGRGHNGRVLDAHVVVRLVALLQAAQNRDGVFDVGLADVDDLEAALEGRVLLDVFAVLVERGCADGAQLAARQSRLEHVAGVDGAFGRARADQRVQLVDEENDFAVRFFDFLEHGLEAVFKLAAIFCAGQHGAEVERDDALVAQALGHVAGDDAAREAFDDGGFAHAGLADQHGIVLGAAAEHLNDAANLFVAADDGVELAAAGEFGEILGVFFERLELAFGILVGHALRTAHGGERLQNGFVRGAQR